MLGSWRHWQHDASSFRNVGTIYNATSARLQERDKAGVGVKEMEGKKVGCRSRRKRRRGRRREGR